MAMAYGRENIPASQPATEGPCWERGTGTEALEQRLADSLAGMGYDQVRERQGLKLDHPRIKSQHCPSQVVGSLLSDFTQLHPPQASVFACIQWVNLAPSPQL